MNMAFVYLRNNKLIFQNQAVYSRFPNPKAGCTPVSVCNYFSFSRWTHTGGATTPSVAKTQTRYRGSTLNFLPELIYITGGYTLISAVRRMPCLSNVHGVSGEHHVNAKKCISLSTEIRPGVAVCDFTTSIK